MTDLYKKICCFLSHNCIDYGKPAVVTVSVFLKSSCSEIILDRSQVIIAESEFSQHVSLLSIMV